MALGDSPESLHEEKVLRQQKAKLKSLREDGKAMQEQIDKAIELRNAKEAKVTMLQDDIKNAQLAIKEQQKALADKRDVKRPLEEATKTLREDEAKLTRLQKKLQNLQTAIDGKQKLLDEGEVVHTRLDGERAALREKEAGLLEHQRKIEELQKIIEKTEQANEERLRSIDEQKERIDKKLKSELDVNVERVRSCNKELETIDKIAKLGSGATDQDNALTRGKLEEASVGIASFANGAPQQIEDTQRLTIANHGETQAELGKVTNELRQQLEECRQLLSQTDLDWMKFWKKLKRGSDSEAMELEADWQKLERLEPELLLKFLRFLQREDERHEGESKPEAYSRAAPDSDLNGFLAELKAKVLKLYEENGLEGSLNLPRKLFVRAMLIAIYEKQGELATELGRESKAMPELLVDKLLVDRVLRGLEGNEQNHAEKAEPTYDSTSGAEIEHEPSAGSQPKYRDIVDHLDLAIFSSILIVASYALITTYGSRVVGCLMDGDCF